MHETPIPTTLDALPNEILIQIASHLDLGAPSIAKFPHEPSPQLTSSDKTPLKTLSRVSWKWRKIVLSSLFYYSRIILDKEPQWVPIDARLIENMQGHLTSLSDHETQIYQKMRGKFKSSSMWAFDESFDDLLINLCPVHEEDAFLKSVPATLWLPRLPKWFTHFTRFVADYNLKHHIRSIVLVADKEYELSDIPSADVPLGRAVSEIWSQIFSHLEPLRVVVAAPPTTLAGLLGTQVLSSDVWAFDMKMHYIELVQPRSSRADHTRESNCRPWDSALVHRRPWTHLGYNEGSSITAYSTYEYHLKQSPKMLYLILLRLAKEAQDCCNIHSFSFYAVFPFSTNLTTVIRALHKVKTLRKVQFQLAPGDENILLDARDKMGRAQPRDLWMEWNESYKAIASFLGSYTFPNGAEFVSSDCSNLSLADEVDRLMSMLRERGTGWRKTELGKWTRDLSLDGAGERSDTGPAVQM
ncbi:hypothetical protein BCR34DRAFT_556059 [Clohesyomyces aquaticus]|uniref:F-box domain-containing protein n=1 Tax=Clohesyomyces aquaticus TaxID=1231657 RepID=A0A1Y2A3P3_9PLEO|nr:hypothetical protein BCR34DRAFT_556059 [Clohesyomyces aquaticus]